MAKTNTIPLTRTDTSLWACRLLGDTTRVMHASYGASNHWQVEAKAKELIAHEALPAKIRELIEAAKTCAERGNLYEAHVLAGWLARFAEFHAAGAGTEPTRAELIEALKPHDPLAAVSA